MNISVKALNLLLTYLCLTFVSHPIWAQKAKTEANSDENMLKKIHDEALTNGKAYTWLAHLSKQIGPRLSGSPQAEKAVQWTKSLMEEQKFDKVYLQEVMVPHWVRGKKEICQLMPSSTKNKSLPPIPKLQICALGNSIGTGAKGIKAKIIEVKNIDELEKLGKKKIQGKIVFFNHVMDITALNTFEAYSKAVKHRGRGPAEAAKYGALAAIVRSMSITLDTFPHTGSTRYEPNGAQIPAVAISTLGAQFLSNYLKKDPKLDIYLETHCENLPEVLSYNVIGEIKGTNKPEEIITVGGHLDSWDLGDGSHDDGAGCIQAIEVLRILKALKIKPKHTIRAVMFMNEENGLRGGLKYAELAQKNQEKHLAAIESDRGAFAPRGFAVENDKGKIEKIKQWIPLLEAYNIHQIKEGGSGSDIIPLADTGLEVTLIGLVPEAHRYFDYHHAATDTFDKINGRELELGAASMAALIYLLDKYGL